MAKPLSLNTDAVNDILHRGVTQILLPMIDRHHAYEVGDCIWVREAWCHANYPLGPYQDGCPVFYRADYAGDPHGYDGIDGCRKWIAPLYMPRSASRLMLDIVSINIIDHIQNHRSLFADLDLMMDIRFVAHKI